MTASVSINDDFFSGLRALADSAFPKHCANCGKVFASASQFILETRAIRENMSGLKQSMDDIDNTIVEVYRNCPCGSTLMDFFSDRRDISDSGLRRREKFAELLAYLIEKGWETQLARTELIKVLRGEKSELLKVNPRRLLSGK